MVRVAVPVEDPEVIVVELTIVVFLGGAVELDGTTVELDIEVTVVLTVLMATELEEYPVDEDPVDEETVDEEPVEADELEELETEDEVPVDDEDDPVELLDGVAVEETVLEEELGLGIGTQFADGGSVA